MNEIQIQERGGGIAPAQASEHRQLSAAQVIARLDDVKTIMANAMIVGVHYGKVEGCGDKPVLLKPGAEMLAMTFRIAPEISYEVKDLGGGHREYMVTCALRHIGTGVVWAYGVGSCTTLEKKYRYRHEWQNKQKIRVENKDIADLYNTCLKMAKKRAQVDATLSALSCSDLFTQDLEDYKEDFRESKDCQAPPPPSPKASPNANNARDAEAMPPAQTAEAKPDFNLNLNGSPANAPKAAPGLTEEEADALCGFLSGLPDRNKTMQIVAKYCDPRSVKTLGRSQAEQLVSELSNVFCVTYDPGVFGEEAHNGK